MNRKELHPIINIEYSQDNRFGLEKGQIAKYSHIYFVIPPSIPQILKIGSYGDASRLSSALTKGHKALNALKPLEDMDAIDNLMSRLLAKSEAVASSRMEGTFSTIHEVFTLAPDASSDTKSVIGYAHALDSLIENLSMNKHKGVNAKLFTDIHVQIAKHDPAFSGPVGKFRHNDQYAWIGRLRIEESTYNPAPPAHVQWLMDNCIEWLADVNVQDEGDAGISRLLTLPVRMAIAHAHFEAIHPFTDGNGRVGRCIWPMQMVLAGYSPLYLSGYVEAEKRSYISALEAFQKRLDLLPMIEFIGDALQESFRETQASRRALLELPCIWKVRAAPRKNSAADRLLDRLVEQPVISVKDVMALLSISEPAAWRAVGQLEKAGILNETTGHQRDRKYSASEVLKILGRPFGTSPEEAIKTEFAK